MGRLFLIKKIASDFLGHIDVGTLPINQAYMALNIRVAGTSIIFAISGSSGSVDADGYTFDHKSSTRWMRSKMKVFTRFSSLHYISRRGKIARGGEVLSCHEDTL